MGRSIARRHFLGGTLGVTAAAVGGAALGQSPAAADAAPTTIFGDFESKATVDSLRIDSPKTDEVLWSDSVVSLSEHAVEYRVAALGNNEATKNPQITFYAGSSFTKVPWTGHEILAWDVMSDSPVQFLGQVTVKDSKGHAWGHAFYIPPFGQHSFDAYVSDVAKAGVDITDIAEINMSLPRQRWPIRVFFDAMRLVDAWPYDHSPYITAATPGLISVMNLPARIGDLRQDLRQMRARIHDTGLPADQALLAQADALEQTLAALAEQAGQSGMDLTTAQGINQQVQTAVNQVARLGDVITVRAGDPNHPDYGIALADSMSLVYPHDKPCDFLPPSARIGLARSESQCAQAVLIPYAEDLTGVAVTVDSVKGPAGGRGLSATVDPIGFLNTTPTDAYHGSSDPTGWYTGWIPDPIRDDVSSVEVKAGDFQPFWITLRSAADAAPGAYTITLKVTTGNASTRTITLRADVWPFQLAERAQLTTSFTFNPAILGIVYGITDPAQLKTMTRQYDDFLENHLLEPDLIYAAPPPTVEDLLYIKNKWGLHHFTVLNLNRVLIDPTKPDTWQAQIDDWINTISTAMEQYEAAGLAEYAYVYGFDEAPASFLPAIKMTLTQIKEKFPDLPIMSTLRDNSMGPNSGLTGLIDIWAPQMDLYQKSSADAAHARGDQVYWYPDIATGHPYPNWFNGFPPIDTRMMMGPMSYQAGVDGVLYYNISRWVNHGPLTDGIFSSWNPATFGTTAGDGSLFYPGANGPLSSIRLQNWRDGMQDYNLLTLLAERIAAAEGHRPPPDINRAKQLLSAKAVVQGNTSYTEDPVTYRKWRSDVAQSIVRLG